MYGSIARRAALSTRTATVAAALRRGMRSGSAAAAARTAAAAAALRSSDRSGRVLSRALSTAAAGGTSAGAAGSGGSGDGKSGDGKDGKAGAGADAGGDEKEHKHKHKKKASELAGEWMKSVGAVVGLLGGSLALRDKLDALFKDTRDIAAVDALIAQSFELSARGVDSVAYALRAEALAKLQPIVQKAAPTCDQYLPLARAVAHLAYGMATYLQSRGGGPGTTPYDAKSWAAFDANNLLQLAHTYTLLANHHTTAASGGNGDARAAGKLGLTPAELERAERGVLSSILRHMGDNPKLSLRERIDLYAQAVELADDNPVLCIRALNNKGVTNFTYASTAEAVCEYERAMAMVLKLEQQIAGMSADQIMAQVLEPYVTDFLHCKSVADAARARHWDAGHFLAKLGQWKSTMAMNLMLAYGHHIHAQSELDFAKMLHYLSLLPAHRYGYVLKRKTAPKLKRTKADAAAAGTAAAGTAAAGTAAAGTAAAGTAAAEGDEVVTTEDDEAARNDREVNGTIKANLLYVLSTCARACLSGDAKLDADLNPQDVLLAAARINAHVTDDNPRAIAARLWYAELLLITAATTQRSAAEMAAAATGSGGSSTAVYATPAPQPATPADAAAAASFAAAADPSAAPAEAVTKHSAPLVPAAVGAQCLAKARTLLPVLARTIKAQGTGEAAKENLARLQSLEALLVVLSPERTRANTAAAGSAGGGSAMVDKWTRAEQDFARALATYTEVIKAGRPAPEALAINEQLKEMIASRSEQMRPHALKPNHFLFTTQHMKLVLERVNIKITPVPF